MSRFRKGRTTTEKSKPVARRGRNAKGLATGQRDSRLPKWEDKWPNVPMTKSRGLPYATYQ
jgi:hypothetical protein